MIPFGGVTSTTGEGWEGIPDQNNPYYLVAGDGIFIHKRMLIGRGVAKIKNLPNYGKVGFPAGFYFDADPIPANLMGQVVNFFERIYDRQHTEAAVLLTMHAETKEWRIFVPTQLVSHGGVNYVFDPTHIRYPWIVVGSIHSHCDFGAGHSGTDTGDASDGNDGLHCTIGHIKRDIPQIVAMVATNNNLVHYHEDRFPMLFDFSEPKQHEAPAWWDRYVEDTLTKTKPVGFELYARFQKSTVVKTETKNENANSRTAKGFQSGDWTWNDTAKRMVHKNWKVHDDGSVTYPSGVTVPSWVGYHNVKREYIPGIGLGPAKTDLPARNSSGSRANGSHLTKESIEFNARKIAEQGAKWDKDGGLLNISDLTDEEKRFLLDIDEEGIGGMALLPDSLVDLLLESNILTDDDFEWACLNEERSALIPEWRSILIKKLFNLTTILKAMGQDVDIKFGPAPKTHPNLKLLEPTNKGSEDMMGAF